jgi:signal transduction histidine kinase
MVFVKNLTWLAKYEDMKIDNQFYEMITATASHEMKTPLNAIICLLQDIGVHL